MLSVASETCLILIIPNLTLVTICSIYGGWLEGIRNKVNSVQFRVKLPDLTEFGKKDMFSVPSTYGLWLSFHCTQYKTLQNGHPYLTSVLSNGLLKLGIQAYRTMT